MADFKSFGLVDNSLKFTPFIEYHEVPGDSPPVFNSFILLNTSQFFLLDGTNFLLLNGV